jgi:hypothetical protein
MMTNMLFFIIDPTYGKSSTYEYNADLELFNIEQTVPTSCFGTWYNI